MQWNETGTYVTRDGYVDSPLDASNIHLAGAHVEQDVRVRSMETACKSGKEAAEACLIKLNKKASSVYIHRRYNTHSVYTR